MNNTNRFLNRLLLFIAGVALLGGGVGAILLASSGQARGAWTARVPKIEADVTSWLRATPLVEPSGRAPSSWLWIPAIALLVAAILLLVSFVLRQGRGKTDVLVSRQTAGSGDTIVRSALAEQAVEESLAGRPELVSSHASTWTVRGTTVLKVAVTLRRGASPAAVVSLVDDTLRSLDALIGVETPALIYLNGGFRAPSRR